MGKRRNVKEKHGYSGTTISSFADLNIGDYVVHENHGLGIYKGIEKVEVDHVVKDYIKIEYAGGSNLYVLATQLDMIQKYADSEAKPPKLNKLGGQEWRKTKARLNVPLQILQRNWYSFTQSDRTEQAISFLLIQNGRRNLRKCSHLRKLTTS